jgi:hypothetical protein
VSLEKRQVGWPAKAPRRGQSRARQPMKRIRRSGLPNPQRGQERTQSWLSVDHFRPAFLMRQSPDSIEVHPAYSTRSTPSASSGNCLTRWSRRRDRSRRHGCHATGGRVLSQAEAIGRQCEERRSGNRNFVAGAQLWGWILQQREFVQVEIERYLVAAAPRRADTCRTLDLSFCAPLGRRPRLL